MANDIYKSIRALLEIPNTVQKLERQQKEIERRINDLIETVSASGMKSTAEPSVPKVEVPAPKPRKKTTKRKAAKRRAPKKKTAKRAVKRAPAAGDPSISDMIESVLKGKRKPLTITEIHAGIVEKKVYTGKSQNLKKMISVVLNRKPMFERTAPGKFRLAKK